MMEFIFVPVVVATVALGIYKIFELFVHRKERLNIIEKLGDKLDVSILKENYSMPKFKLGGFSSGALKAACLLMGIGLGLLVGFFLTQALLPEFTLDNNRNWNIRETVSVVYGAPVLLFGGFGLLIAFIVEMKYSKKE